MADGADGQIFCAALRCRAHWGLGPTRPIDTKLARETKAGTILQLCLYSDLLRIAQGVAPEFMYVVPPWTDFQPQQYRFTDYAAYFRKAKRALRAGSFDRARRNHLSRAGGTLRYLPMAGRM